jgi:hypothetical protein
MKIWFSYLSGCSQKLVSHYTVLRLWKFSKSCHALHLAQQCPSKYLPRHCLTLIMAPYCCHCAQHLTFLQQFYTGSVTGINYIVEELMGILLAGPLEGLNKDGETLGDLKRCRQLKNTTHWNLSPKDNLRNIKKNDFIQIQNIIA